MSPYGNLNTMPDPAPPRSKAAPSEPAQQTHQALTRPPSRVKAAWLVPALALCLAAIAAYAWPSSTTDAPRLPSSPNGSDRNTQATVDAVTKPPFDPATIAATDR